MKKKVDIISMDNKPVSPQVQEENNSVDKRFVKVKPIEKKDGILIRNGRVFIKLDSNYGMYADNGDVFKI